MEFFELIKRHAPHMTDEQAEKFRIYYEMLIFWNENRCNLTAITAPEEVVTKHFLDSVLPSELIPVNAKCIDIGTGAGFPGVPLMIMRPDIEMTLLDSLRKRVDFLSELTDRLGISARLLHARCEDAAKPGCERGRYDIALTRAVAQTNTLLEWTSPFLKTGGMSLMYKSATARDELAGCENALSVLHMDAQIRELDAPWGKRCIICARQLKKTPDKFPRRAGAAKSMPL